MKTTHEEFIKDFKELLKKHDAEFVVEFESKGWYHKDVPTINFNWNEQRGVVESLELPSYINKD